ncbi:MAG: hypothetical protein D8M52_02665 [Chlorobi bacterium]|nr:MAG: hypothetical protein F9K28_10225 [Bacteroidota bacterium]MBE2266157.1 hypothetical protein [Flavobacteriales bacterium]MBL1160605.1 hypothetical protein [Chlorobiota bacterium]MBW7854564.1 hypothetical protein [Candidatus Kapabacteria bacterium]MCC6331661.1 hypothetical protein [Ignavibacteria bacterium]
MSLTDRNSILNRQVLETSSFFSRLEEFGFFDRVSEHLPAEFTMIYEIARVIEDATHSLAMSLAPVLELDEALQDAPTTTMLLPHVPEAKEYEADLIRSVTEVRHIYPHQFLLPETVFLQRLAERSLWLPRPRTPRNFRYQTDSNRFAPDDRKQKVYILFDTSSSMQHHYRIHLAKAIAYIFLRRNQRELGTVFCRTFDVKIGDRHVARDIVGFDQLISTIMHITELGNGTVLQKAIEAAIDDISHEPQLSQTQILVITDGVAHVDLEHLQILMGTDIRLSTVKIGRARMLVDDKVIEDQVFHSSSDEAKRLRELLNEKRDLQSAVSHASGHKRSENIKAHLDVVQKQIDMLKTKLAVQVSEEYGLEIQRLSTVYIEIDDIEPAELFSFSEEKVVELEELAEALVQTLRSEHQIEDIKRAAMLYDHLYLLMQYNTVDAPRLERYAKELEGILGSIMNQPGTSDVDVSITDQERFQLRNMLEGGFGSKRTSLARLLRYLFMYVKRWWHTRRKFRMYERLTGKVQPNRRKDVHIH